MLKKNLLDLTLQALLIQSEEVPSTNDQALQAGKEGAPHLTGFTAESQTAGRGRRGRTWMTFPEKSLAVSFVVRLQNLQHGTFLPFITALALARTVSELTPSVTGGTLGADHMPDPLVPTLKWPNDLLLNGKKGAGILVESCLQGQSGFFVVGVGLNINTPEEGLPADFLGTTLEAETGAPFIREDVLNKFFKEFEESIEKLEKEGFSPFYEDYLRSCETIGKSVTWCPTVRSQDGLCQEGNRGEPVTGIAIGLTRNGSLQLKTSCGEIVEVVAGEILADL